MQKSVNTRVKCRFTKFGEENQENNGAATWDVFPVL